jgi:hypothetical protein
MLHGYVFAGFSRFMHHVPYFIIPVSIGQCFPLGMNGLGEKSEREWGFAEM